MKFGILLRKFCLVCFRFGFAHFLLCAWAMSIEHTHTSCQSLACESSLNTICIFFSIYAGIFFVSLQLVHFPEVFHISILTHRLQRVWVLLLLFFFFHPPHLIRISFLLSSLPSSALLFSSLFFSAPSPYSSFLIFHRIIKLIYSNKNERMNGKNSN